MYINHTNYSKQIKNLLVEMEIPETDPLADTVRQFADLVGKIDSLKAQLKHLEDQYPSLEAPIYKILEDLQTVDTDINKSIKVGNELIVTFARKPYEQTKVKYKEAFEYLYGKVNGAIKKLADEAKDATASIAKVKGSVKVTKLEGAASPKDFNAISQEFTNSVDTLDKDFQKFFATVTKQVGSIKESGTGDEPYADFYKNAIESASGDKISHTELDDYDRTIYWGTKNPNVTYYIGDNHDIIRYNGETGKSRSIGSINDYDEPTHDYEPDTDVDYEEPRDNFDMAGGDFNDGEFWEDKKAKPAGRDYLKNLSPDEQTQLKEYIDSMKEIKKEIAKLVGKAKQPVQEQGGNMSSGLTLKDENDDEPQVNWELVEKFSVKYGQTCSVLTIGI